MGWAETGAQLMFGPKRDGPKRAGPNRGVTVKITKAKKEGKAWEASSRIHVKGWTFPWAVFDSLFQKGGANCMFI